MQRLTVDIDLQRFLTGPNAISAPTNLWLKYGSNNAFEVQFVSGGLPVDLPDGTVFQFGVKLPTLPEAIYLVQTSDVEKTGDGATALYTFFPTTNTTRLAAALGQGATELLSIAAKLELKWTTPDSQVSSTTPLGDIVCYNNLNRGVESVPVPVSGGIYQFQDAGGVVRFQLRVTATGGVFETPDGSGGWDAKLTF